VFILSVSKIRIILAYLFFRLPGLLDILKGVELSQELVVSSFIKLFRTLCCGFGKSFTRQKVMYCNYVIPFCASKLIEPLKSAMILFIRFLEAAYMFRSNTRASAK
jgi:hypothetical protein